MLGITNLKALVQKSLDEQVNDLPRLAPNAYILKTTGYDAKAVVLDAILVFLSLLKVYPVVAKKVKSFALSTIYLAGLSLILLYLTASPIIGASAPITSPIDRLPEIKETINTAWAPVFQWPVGGYISQHFWWGHRAIDLPNPIGTQVHPTEAGEVVLAKWDGDYGNSIVIKHADGFSSRYGHLAKILVKVGDKVNKKTVIGLTGATGKVTGPHLHFELLWNGVQVDPEKFLPDFKPTRAP